MLRRSECRSIVVDAESLPQMDRPAVRERDDVSCSIHIHTVPIMAIAAHPKGLLAAQSRDESASATMSPSGRPSRRLVRCSGMSGVGGRPEVIGRRSQRRF
jgi:hypothetical protein